MNRSIFSPAAPIVALVCASAVSAADMSIADLAPANAMIVIGSNDMGAAKAAFDRTGFKTIWDTPALRTWGMGAMGDSLEQMRKDMDAIGVDLDKLMVAPTGAMGLAMWMGDDDAEEGDLFFFADFGDHADGLEAQIMELMNNGENEKLYTLDQIEFGDTTIYSMERVENEDDDADNEDEWDAEWDEDNWQGGAGAAADNFSMDELHYARMGGTLFASSDLAQLEHALETVEDKAFGEGLAQSNAYRNALAAVGDAHITMTVMASDLLKDLAGGVDMLGPMLDQLGLESISAIAMGMQFDTDDAMVESRFAVLTPEKNGLMALLDNPPLKVSPPAFVNADAATFSAFQFNFAQLLPTIERSLGALPQEQAGQAIMMFEQMKMTLGPLFNAMGPEIYMVANIDKPYSAESQKQIVMIRVKDEGAINQVIQSFGPMMGLASRDFLGNTIWAGPPGGLMGASLPTIGIGGGFISMGEESSVENAMRALTRGDGDGLADTDTFKRAAKPMGNEAIAYGFTSTKQTMEFTEWSFKNMRAMVEAQLDAQPGMDEIDPEWREQIIEESMAMIPEFMQNVPSLDPVIKNMGDGAFELRSTDRGFEGRWMILRPNN